MAVPTTPPPMIATSQLMTAWRLAHESNATIRSAASSAVMTGCTVSSTSAGGDPLPRPGRGCASAATPSAVASGVRLTRTGTWSRSACACSSTRDLVSPPSTRSEVSGPPRSAATAPASSATEAAMPSATARAMCPLRRSTACSPASWPRACGAQCGAPRPASAGTNVTPPESGTVPATRVEVGRGWQDADLGQPAQRGPGRVHLPVEAVRGRCQPAARRPTRTGPRWTVAAFSPVVTSRNAPVP